MIASHRIIPAHVSGMVPFVECKIRFTSLMFNSNQNCRLICYVRTNCTDDVQFNKLYLRFNISNYNQYCVLNNPEVLKFEPNKIHQFTFDFMSQKQDIGKDLEVTSVSLELGNRDTGRVLVMHWKGDCKNALSQENHTIQSFSKLLYPHSQKHKSQSGAVTDWNALSVIPSTRY